MGGGAMPTAAAVLTCVSNGVGGGEGNALARASTGGGALGAAVDLSGESVEAGIPISSRASTHGTPVSCNLGRGRGATWSSIRSKGFAGSAALGGRRRGNDGGRFPLREDRRLTRGGRAKRGENSLPSRRFSRCGRCGGLDGRSEGARKRGRASGRSRRGEKGPFFLRDGHDWRGPDGAA